MKGNSQKMNCERVYEGQKYSFTCDDVSLGHGGNGAVYDIKFVGNDFPDKYPVVAKFFEYDKENYKAERYERFKNEIEVVSRLKGIEGIIPILDENCPEETPESKDAAWYLMPKAEPFKLNRHRKLSDKISDMIKVGEIIRDVHSMKIAHRDIKPENILVLNGKLVLSDFGLCWNQEEEGITRENEKIGPYRIMPPELENVHSEFGTDYRKSDVYLFSKVVWMTLKEDNIGFRGEYQRGDDQIYLDKAKYHVKTLEPLHEMMEKATHEKPEMRIDIDECLYYLSLQKSIFENEESISAELMNQMIYDENTKRIVALNRPSELVYEDLRVIFSMLKEICSISEMYVSNPSQGLSQKQIQVTDFSEIGCSRCAFLYYVNGNKAREYLCSVKKMTYKKDEESVVLELNDIPDDEMSRNNYEKYSKTQRGMNNSSNVYLGKDEIVTLRKPVSNETEADSAVRID